jgi:hypothetical protein
MAAERTRTKIEGRAESRNQHGQKRQQNLLLLVSESFPFLIQEFRNGSRRRIGHFLLLEFSFVLKKVVEKIQRKRRKSKRIPSRKVGRPFGSSWANLFVWELRDSDKHMKARTANGKQKRRESIGLPGPEEEEEEDLEVRCFFFLGCCETRKE